MAAGLSQWPGIAADPTRSDLPELVRNAIKLFSQKE
jgi:hypothetical protein